MLVNKVCLINPSRLTGSRKLFHESTFAKKNFGQLSQTSGPCESGHSITQTPQGPAIPRNSHYSGGYLQSKGQDSMANRFRCVRTYYLVLGQKKKKSSTTENLQ